MAERPSLHRKPLETPRYEPLGGLRDGGEVAQGPENQRFQRPALPIAEEIRFVGASLRKKYSEDSKVVGGLEAFVKLREWIELHGASAASVLAVLDAEIEAGNKRHHVLQNDIESYRVRLATLKDAALRFET